jgi:N-acetylmuramic acid 6-phosphate etherase
MTDISNDLPVTEQENARTRDISSRGTAEMLQLINDEDAGVPAAVGREIPRIARAVEGIVERLRHGGRLFYVGTGTSGRLGVLDASECPPTFGVAPELVQGVIAGGYEACHRAVEASEDDGAAGAHDLDARGVTSRDAVVGIAASGRTPYTIGAVEHARGLGAFTAAITCVPDSPITRAAEVSIVPVVGPEVLAGSTRMKAGTAQKLVLNMLSTAAMMRLGYVSGNRMTNLRARNSKLQARSLRILMAEAGIDERSATGILDRAGGELPTAVVMAKTGGTPREARAALDASGGVIALAVESTTRDTKVTKTPKTP